MSQRSTNAAWGLFVLLVVTWVVASGPRDLARAASPYSNADLGPVLTLTGALAASSPYFSPVLQNQSAHSVKCVVNVTQITGNLTVTIYGVDGASGQAYAILASGTISSGGATILTVGPGLTAASNSVANDVLPYNWRVGAAVSSGPVSATVGCSTVE